MSIQGIVPGIRNGIGPGFPQPQPRPRRGAPTPLPFRFTAQMIEDDTAQRQAELFYLQKQIQSQTPMVIVLEDGELVEDSIEWYDRHSLKVRGKQKSLIYKSAIKYMYKVADAGQ